ncbi:MAG: hypothetical protein K2M91_06390, partial [Lachnospiraceae bacterium]|nr:hypothetical protein [Lachnospiraceae bacterium]
HNLLQSGQLPVHQIDMQDKQGYCLFLKVDELEKEEFLLSDATLNCIYYIRENLDSGVWISLPILEDCIMEFSVSPQGTLLYKGNPVETYRDAVKEQFIAQVNARLLEEKAKHKAADSAVEFQSRKLENENFSVPNQIAPITTNRQTPNCLNQNSLKFTVKRIIEKRLEKYSEILFDVNTDWLKETIIDGNRCIIIDLNSIDAKNAEILSQMQLYTGTRKSITRVDRQIIFKGYD